MATPLLAGPRRLRHVALAGEAEGRRADLAAGVALAAPMVAALLLALHGGGFFRTSWQVAEIALLAALGALLLAAGGGWGGRRGTLAIGGWAALAGWQGLSSLWASEPAAATAAMHRTLLYTAALALGLLGVRGEASVRRVADAMLAFAALLAAGGVLGRLAPGLASAGREPRLATPIGYWNGLGALLALGCVLAVGVAGHPGRGRVGRALAQASIPLLALAMLLTLSRGAVLAAIVGTLALVAVAPGRLETIGAALAGAATSAPALLLANGGGLVWLTRELTPDGGARVAVAVSLVGGMAAAALIQFLWLGPVLGRLEDRRRLVARAVVGLAAAAAAGGTIVVLASDDPASSVRHDLAAFRHYAPSARPEQGSIPDQLAAPTGTGRWQTWGVALDEFQSAPALGTGAGDYAFWWRARRPIDLSVTNAHSLYLETLGESGLIGLGLLAVPALAALVALAHARRRPGHRDRTVAAVAALVIAVHAGGDWDWQLPAVVLPGIALGAAALKGATLACGRERAVGGRAGGAVALVCGAAIILATGPLASALRVDQARAAARSGELRRALGEASAARAADPGSSSAALLAANLLTDLGRPRAGERAFATAAARSPKDAAILADWASARLRRGDRAGARALVRRARGLDPRDWRLSLLHEALR